ncbi:MAG: DNA alkylation repair protein [Bacteroidaceae bacterium]|nr:DNA alkylation repair protein [Bacteroidaceae bacterium]
MTEQTQEKIRLLKQEFRANMNGMASSSMRNAGLGYRVNFGIELPRLQAIAREFHPDHELAQELWKEDVRESKIVATLLQPVATFYAEIADIWAESITTAEMAGIASVNLFQHLPYALEKAFQWMASEGEYVQMCGYHTVIRLMRKNELPDRLAEELVDHAICTVGWSSNSSSLRLIAWKALSQFASLSESGLRYTVAALKAAGFDRDAELRPYLEYLQDEG